jgi:lipopolysaccharide transport system permease protein
MTPVFYPLEALPAGFRAALKLNPLTTIVESFRRILLWQRPPDWIELGTWTLVGLLVVGAGLRWFNYTKQDFADVV